MKQTKMDPFQTKPKKKANPKYNNFLEAFKEIGANTVKTFTKDVVKGTAKNALDTITGKQANQADQTPDQPFDFDQFLNQQERRIKQQERSRYEAIRREEKIIFSREKQEVKLKIETIQTQIKALAKEQTSLMKEVDKAAFQAVTDPGVYHSNFFDRLLSLIKLAKKKIAESRTWLQMHNSRSKKRMGYWAQFKKKGTSFSLSGERTVATQTG